MTSKILLFDEKDNEEVPLDTLLESSVNDIKDIVIGNWQLEEDSSEDDAIINRVGDIPMEWYNNEDHIGYDIDGHKLAKQNVSALDQLIDNTDNPNAWRTIIDKTDGSKKVLTNEDLEILFNLQQNKTPNSAHDPHADYPTCTVNFDPLNHPLARNQGPSKTSYLPNNYEIKKIQKMVRAIENKKMKETQDVEEPKEQGVFDLWENHNESLSAIQKFKQSHMIPKPERNLPGTYESYRPPPEYLPTEEAVERFNNTREIDRKEHFLPQIFAALRHVPMYHHTIQDQFQRCIDLCLFPRMQRTKLIVDPKKLLPDLPDPKDLRPFPEKLSFVYRGHTSAVRTISVSPSGQYLATGCDDHLLRIYEVHTGRLLKRYDLGGVVQRVCFSPLRTVNLLVAAVEYSLVFIVPAMCAHPAICDHSARLLRAPGGATGANAAITQSAVDADEKAFEHNRLLEDDTEQRAEFVDASAKERQAGIIVKVVFHSRPKKISFHNKGDYLCAICPKDHIKYRQVVMLQISRRKVFCPFRKFTEVVTDCKFHPKEPYFFISTTNTIRCYNLLAHCLQKKYKSPGGITTCIDIHPEGENFLVGDSTSHTMWFDADYSDKAYKRMKSHLKTVTAIAYHPESSAYPLFASAGSDMQCHIFYGKVYDDMTKNALIVPVKILKHNSPVYDFVWHPCLPWCFTATEDGIVTCWTE